MFFGTFSKTMFTKFEYFLQNLIEVYITLKVSVFISPNFWCFNDHHHICIFHFCSDRIWTNLEIKFWIQKNLDRIDWFVKILIDDVNRGKKIREHHFKQFWKRSINVSSSYLWSILMHNKGQTTLAVGGRITVRLVSSLTSLDLTQEENMLLFVCSEADESNLVKLETSHGMILTPTTRVLCQSKLIRISTILVWTNYVSLF